MTTTCVNYSFSTGFKKLLISEIKRIGCSEEDMTLRSHVDGRVQSSSGRGKEVQFVGTDMHCY